MFEYAQPTAWTAPEIKEFIFHLFRDPFSILGSD